MQVNEVQETKHTNEACHVAIEPVLTKNATQLNTSIPKSLCCICREPTEPHDIIIQNRSWHAKCFQCDLCHEGFDNDEYTIIDGKVLHKSCYNGLYSPRCFICAGILAGRPTVSALGKQYHSECFKCLFCNNIISSDDTFHNIDEFPVCHKCYIERRRTCIKCSQIVPMNNQPFLFEGHTYYLHDSCSICSECGHKINHSNFKILQNKVICTRCYICANQYECERCHQAILPKDLVTFNKKGNWHNLCFVCEKCGISLRYSTPSVSGDALVCDQCITHFCDHCSVCFQKVERDLVTWAGRTFHSNCMKCSSCQKQLQSTDKYFVCGKLFCKDCFLRC